MAASPRPRWQIMRDAAAAGMARGPDTPDHTPSGDGAQGRALRHVMSGALADALHRARGRERQQSPSPQRRRTDVRLVPATLLVWATALAGGWLAPAALAVLCAALSAAAAALLLGVQSRRRSPVARSLRATLAVGLLLSSVAGAHSAGASTLRSEGAVSEAVAAGASVVAEVDVAGTPKRLRAPGRSGLADRWLVPVTLRVLVFDGRRVEAPAKLLVVGGRGWQIAEPGQRFRTTGTLKTAGQGEAEAGMLAASSAPQQLSAAPGWESLPAKLGQGFRTAAERLAGDARGLLPGMVTGDTAALDAQLAAAMKTVGMTHLTAVSGANCSLILGALLLAARSLRFPRAVAATVAATGLGLFVLMVGPDASVLRAALMGAIGLSALAFGRAGRGLSLLCLASTGLLLGSPELAGDFGFVLSVLATLGIVVAGGPLMGWFPPAVPRWAAAGLAVPLSAQLFCGPVIVLLQPQFSSYALAANLAAAAFVAPVTLTGTAAVPLVPLVPDVAALPIAVAGMFADGVAGIARYFAALPGAALPWPEGAFGAATMAGFSAVSLAGTWAATHPAAVRRLVLILHGQATLLLTRILDHPAASAAARKPPVRHRPRGLEHRPGRGTLRVCKPTSRRNHQWLLPRPNAPGPRPRTPPPGGTLRRRR